MMWKIILLVIFALLWCIGVAGNLITPERDDQFLSESFSENRHLNSVSATSSKTPYSPNPHPGHSPCSVTHDTKYGGDFINCQNRAISEIDSSWFPATATSISLDDNKITRLRNNTFSHLSSLRSLSIKNSLVKTIEVDALHGAMNLDYLNLEENFLPIAGGFPFGMFRHVPFLRQLLIGSSKIKHSNDFGSNSPTNDYLCNHSVSPYSKYIDIFDYLSGLEVLSINTFSVLCIGDEFAKFQNLTTLIFDGGHILLAVNNDSFIGLQTLQLKHLTLQAFERFAVRFDSNAFQYLSFLDSIFIADVSLGNDYIANVVSPFVNKNLTSVEFWDTSIAGQMLSPNFVFEDGIISVKTMKYLGQVCISRMTWTDSSLFAIEPRALNTPVWRRCLKTLDLSNNPLGFIWRSVLFQLSRFTALETLILSSNDDPQQFHDYLTTPATNECSFTYKKLLTSPNTPEYGQSNLTHNAGVYYNRYRDIVIPNAFPFSNGKSDLSSMKSNFSHKFTSSESSLNHQRVSQPLRKPIKNLISTHPSDEISGLYVRLPPSLKVLKLAHLTEHTMFSLDMNTTFIKTEHFEELYAIGFETLFHGTRRWKGLDNLKVVDFTSSGLMVANYFFDDFPNIEILILSSILPAHYFDNVMPCKRLIRNMTKLRHLDISNNGLNSLLHGTFSTNSNLTHLGLADNRFSAIPFDLRLTPKLQVLDLRRNSILFLTEEEMAVLDAHVTNMKHFSLNLMGNGLVCVCSQMQFLGWLQSTEVVLDQIDSYTCSSQSGEVAVMTVISDMQSFWRQCSGWSWFMLSLLLALLLVLLFLSTYLMTRFRNAIKAFMVRLVVPQFRPFTPQDYVHDVFIGYADDDWYFMRNVLREFLEDELHLKTFIHHRDFRSSYEGEQFYAAIRDSWRVLLVITENFLQRYEMADTVMKFAATSSSPMNQGRVFLVIEESQLTAVPDYLYNVVDDSRIIIVSDFTYLGYAQQQAIKNCLRPVGLGSKG